MNAHIFIISWAGQHEYAVSIANNLLSVTEKISIVYSDPDPDLTLDAQCQLIRRPNHLFWGDKFKACLDACGNNPILVIHADCTCPDWAELAQKYHTAVTATPVIGVWAPKIEGTYYHLTRTKIAAIQSTSLSIVAQTDGIVFALSLPVLKRMRAVNYSQNIYGWGIDWIFCCAAYVFNLIVVVDESISVNHPISTGYDLAEARKGMNQFLNSLTPLEIIQYRLLKSYLKSGKTK